MTPEALNAELVQSGSVLLLDKPLTWTSFDVVKKVKHLLRRQFNLPKIKVGHAGTLDPLATGLLIVCTGRSTKQIEAIAALPKTYTGKFTIGATTASYDLESPVEKSLDWSHITTDQISSAAQSMLGIQDQLPPIFSAKKVDGKRAYASAREGIEVKLKTSRIEIFEFEITAMELPEVEFLIRCSKGTYIRSIAHDFGEKLGVGAYLSELRRTEIGHYSVEQSMSPQALERFLANISESPPS